jgi:large subunit ribosomal protein L13
MNSLSYKTEFLKKNSIQKEWFVVDAEGQTLGRICSQIAKVIRGKHKTSFTPFMDCGDHVIVINAEKIRLTGKKMTDKEYITHTGFPGGQRFATPKATLAKHPTRVVEWAVRGMLPKNRLGRTMFTSLHAYAGAEHPHAAQNPKVLKF